MAVRFWHSMATPYRLDDMRRVAGAAAPAARGAIRRFADGESLVEGLSLEAIEPYRESWRELALRAIEPNVFLEPDFALSAALHLPAAQRPEFVAVWQGAGFDPRARLIGLWALERRRAALPPAIGRSWQYRHSALGAPLIDRFSATRSVDSLLNWLPTGRPGQSALIISDLVQGGPVHDLLIARSVAAGRRWALLGESERAILLPGRCGREALALARSTKHRREIDRLARRLSEQGAVESFSATSPEDVREATEWFLALEQVGWKGKRGTALLSDVGDAAFVRSAMRLMAREGKCRIDWISLDGAPIAMAIVLFSGRRAYFWKTTYDERLGHFSPGVQLARELLDRQLALTSIDLTDSCAIADHPMIDRIWPDRQRMADLLIGVNGARPVAFSLVERRERLRRGLRAAVKSAAYSALGRRPS